MVTTLPVRVAIATLLCIGAAVVPTFVARTSASPAPAEWSGQQIPKDCAVPLRNAAKYVAEWRRIEAPQGSAKGPWGSLSWTKTRVEIEVRAGYVLDVCVAEDDGGGIVFGEHFSVGGPDTVTKRTSDIFVVGFGVLKGQLAPTSVDAGR